MRDDMDKVLVERPRTRGGWARYPRTHMKNLFFRDEDAGTRERGAVYREKWLNENLRPLERFLKKNVGRPWNKVHSEMSEYLSPNNTIQQHVFVHLWQMVARNVVEKDGVLYEHGRHGPEPLRETKYWAQLYVCPKSGILKLYKEKKKHGR